MKLDGLTLVIPDKPDSERDSVAKVWVNHGGDVLRLGRFWEPPELRLDSVRVYGNDTFCLVLAQKLDLILIQPKDELLAEIPEKYLRRKIRVMPLNQARGGRFPQFLKSAVPKLFKAAIYTSREAFERECEGLDDATLVLSSNIVEVVAEARCFVLDGQVLDCAIYEGCQSRASALEFANTVVKEITLPSSCVMDVGFFTGLGWGIVEFNATWGAGLNGCDPELVYPAIAGAISKKEPTK